MKIKSKKQESKKTRKHGSMKTGGGPDTFEILISFRIEDPRFYFKIKDFDKIGRIKNYEL